MSVYPRVFGRELPCSVKELLQIPHLSLSAKHLDRLMVQTQLGPGDANSLYQLGLAHLSCSQAGLARKRLAQAVLADPGAAAHHLAFAAALEMVGQHVQAGAHVELVAENASLYEQVDPGLSPSLLYCAAGLALERAGDWQSAITRYQSATLRSEPELFAHHRLAAIYLAHGMIADATLHLRTILSQQPGDQACRICLGHVLQSDGRFAEAAWEYEQALCLEPDGWELPSEVSRQLQEMESSAQAIEVLEALIAAQPHFPDLRMRLGNLYSMRGDDARACEQYGTALSLHPEYLECHIALARHELRMGRQELAEEHFRDAIAINNQQVEIYAGLAMACHRSLGQAQAAEYLISAGKIANNSAVLLAQIGMLRDGVGEDAAVGTELSSQRLEELVAGHQQLLASHPEWNDIRVELGMFLRLLKRADEAYTVLRQAALSDPNCSPAWLHLGLALNDLGQGDDAASALANTLQLDSQWAELQYRLALAYCGDLEFDMALEKLQETAADPLDAERQVFLALDDLRMTGSVHSTASDRRTVAVARA